jgi:hypothetical protein
MKLILDTMSQMKASWTHLCVALVFIPSDSLSAQLGDERDVTRHHSPSQPPPPSTILRPAPILPTIHDLLAAVPDSHTQDTLHQQAKMGITLPTPTQIPQCMFPFGPFLLSRSPLITVLRTQEWPEHHSRDDGI